MPKKIKVLIPDGEYALALPVIRSLGVAGEMEIEVVALNRWYGAAASRYCSGVHLTSAGLQDAVRLDAILNAVTRSRPDVILPTSLEGARLTLDGLSEISRLGAAAILPDRQTLELANDKASLCGFAKSLGLLVPSFLVYPDQVPDPSKLDTIAYPVLRKPAAMCGGLGIQSFNDALELKRFLAQDPSAKSNARCLLQDYLQGSDISLNVLCRDGEILAHTIQSNTIRMYPRFGAAAGMHFLRDDAVMEMGRRLMSALRWNGVANLDMIRCSSTGKVLLLEVNPRFWSSLMGSTHAGVNFPLLAVRCALGLAVPATDYQEISFVDKSIVFEEFGRNLLGRPRLPRFRFRNSSLASVVNDPKPVIAGFCDGLRRRLTRGKKEAVNDAAVQETAGA